jgi:hypothetical protein
VLHYYCGSKGRTTATKGGWTYAPKTCHSVYVENSKYCQCHHLATNPCIAACCIVCQQILSTRLSFDCQLQAFAAVYCEVVSDNVPNVEHTQTQRILGMTFLCRTIANGWESSYPCSYWVGQVYVDNHLRKACNSWSVGLSRPAGETQPDGAKDDHARTQSN